ncbi:M23 family metallopeptidase [Leptothrix discophora]|uniref:M23 family metallopeptidase n=1 Tax=Leptothrix discophora TaxID=89 RepID=A0ABT9G367_LEPDI|nr:M23 family metallopeptidase [Leptothrix discophora]MDP4300908.1 M23 family metallopeptidase [Leptothrix discophora]
MDILITHGGLARTRSFHVSPATLVTTVIALLLALMMLSGVIYHMVLLKAVHAGWPIVADIAGLVVPGDTGQRDRFLRENLDAMAQKVGEMQAKVVRLEAMGERIAGLAGIKPEEIRAAEAADATARPSTERLPVARGGAGGPYLPVEPAQDKPSLAHLNELVDTLDTQAGRSGDVFTLIESRLLERRLELMMVPSAPPVLGPVGSGFGFRIDPFTSRPALHTGLDFPGPVGTPIRSAAAGVVLSAEPAGPYGQMIEIDHGNGLVTRYAHTSRMMVRPGELVRRGQTVAQVGNTGRSTGAHLHFEVLLNGVPQNPARFLARGESLSPKADRNEAKAGAVTGSSRAR